jgi:hypothetical protein
VGQSSPPTAKELEIAMGRGWLVSSKLVMLGTGAKPNAMFEALTLLVCPGPLITANHRTMGAGCKQRQRCV